MWQGLEDHRPSGSRLHRSGDFRNGLLANGIVRRALTLEGTCTGEHGIGRGKMDFLIAEHGEAVSAMRAIKQTIDPNNPMNPAKILRIQGPGPGPISEAWG